MTDNFDRLARTDEMLEYPGDNVVALDAGSRVRAGFASWRGSYSDDDPDRPRWDRETRLVEAFDYHDEHGRYLYSKAKGVRSDGEKAFVTGRIVQGHSELDLVRRENPEEFFRLPGLEHYRKGSGGEPDVLYRLPELVAEMAERPDERVYICEGERDVETLRSHGFIATTNPNGALKWRPEFNRWFAGRDVGVVGDNDERGRQNVELVVTEALTTAKSVKRIDLPGLPPKGDVTDWFAAGRTHGDFLAAVEKAPVLMPEPASALSEWNAGDDDWTAISPRRWLLGNVFCRRFVSSLIADGGVGKTAMRLLQALALATGRELTGEKVFERCRVLFVSLEDDRDELRRRVRAAMLHHAIEPHELEGWLFLSAPEGKAGKLVTADRQTRRPAVAGMKAEIERVIVERSIDVLILDPLVKAHDVEENDNSAMDVVIQTLSSLAVAHDIAVDVLHHTSKGAADPGNADRGRGASAVKNGARLVYTLTAMSPDEAERFGIEEGERRSYVRVDSGKVNITPPLDRAKWFKLVGVSLKNGDARHQNGDNVQTVEPWTAPGVWDGISDDVLRRILDEIEAGVPAEEATEGKPGSRYSYAPRAGWRAASNVVLRHAPDKNDKQARAFVKELIRRGHLAERDYHDPNSRKSAKGLFVVTAREVADAPM